MSNLLGDSGELAVNVIGFRGVKNVGFATGERGDFKFGIVC